MSQGPGQARSFGHVGVALGSSLGSRQVGGGMSDNIRRALDRTSQAVSRVPSGQLPGFGQAVFAFETDATGLAGPLVVPGPGGRSVAGLGFLELACPYVDDGMGGPFYPDTADRAVVTITGDPTPIVYPLRNAAGRSAVTFLCTGPDMADIAIDTVQVVGVTAIVDCALTFYYPTLNHSTDTP